MHKKETNMEDGDLEDGSCSPTLSDFCDSLTSNSPDIPTEEQISAIDEPFEKGTDSIKGEIGQSDVQKNCGPWAVEGITSTLLEESFSSEDENEEITASNSLKGDANAIRDASTAIDEADLPLFEEKRGQTIENSELELKISNSDLSGSDVNDLVSVESPRHLQASSESEGTEFRHRNVSDRLPNVEEIPQTSGVTAHIVEDKTAGQTTATETTDSENTDDRGLDAKSSLKNLSLFKYFMDEISRGYFLELDGDKYAEKREKVYTFMKIPREVEKLMTFGFMLCLDCFVFIFTFLPIRMMGAIWKLIFGFLLCKKTRLLEPAQICDLLKGCIMIVACLMLEYVDFSVLYHTVRGQSVIKLYVVYNMLEIADRLFSSFGQDILDALFWTATEPRDRRRQHIGILPHFALGVVYVFLHGVLVLFQATCLNVAVNSHNKALLVIMISNQFVELKGSVFKRFEKNNLFQMACSDIRERFHYLILVTIVALRNLTEFNWNMEHLYVIMPYLLATLSSEYFVDWVKHAFITKFNDIPPEVYREYRSRLAQDATSSREKNAHADHFDLVSRRMGFIPLPLGALVIRVVKHSIRIHGGGGVALVIATYFFLLSVKILNSIIFLGKAAQYTTEYPSQEPTQNPKSVPQSSPSAPASGTSTAFPSQHAAGQEAGKQKDKEQSVNDGNKKRTKTLAEIDRYTLCSKEIVIF